MRAGLQLGLNVPGWLPALPNLAISGARSLVDDLNRTGYCKWLSSLAATISSGINAEYF